MNEYIFLFRGGKTSTANEAELQEHEEAWDEWMDVLEEEGALIDGLPMTDIGMMVTEDGMQEGDFGSGDGVGGYLIIECEDLDKATELASDCPIFEFAGKVEVRALINERGE